MVGGDDCDDDHAGTNSTSARWGAGSLRPMRSELDAEGLP